jgi:ubiquinone/menaquinone biosynthesis C-methylase UbiE
MKNIREGNYWYERFLKTLGLVFALISNYFVEDTTLLDAGCGYHPQLAAELMSFGVLYYGIDCDWHSANHKQNELPDAQVSCQDMSNLFMYQDNCFEIVLAKASLSHVKASRQKQALRELWRVASKAVIIIEVTDLSISESDPELFQNFYRASNKIMEQTGVDPDFGKKLPQLIEEVLPDVEYEYFDVPRRPAGDYSKELINVAAGGADYLCHYGIGPDTGWMMDAMLDMRRYLEGGDISFVPHGYAVAHIPKD